MTKKNSFAIIKPSSQPATTSRCSSDNRHRQEFFIRINTQSLISAACQTKGRVTRCRFNLLIKFILFIASIQVANQLQVERIGQRHQAGSDSLLTAMTFFKLKERFFVDNWQEVGC